METTPMVQRLLLLICAFTSVAAAQSAPPRKAPPRKDIPAIAKAANGSVVSIVMSDKDGKPIVQGSGFFVSKDGLVVTNYHVISEGSSAVVKLPDGAFYAVDGMLASDKERDIAVIKAHGESFRTVPLGNSDRVQVGEEVVAIGNPLSLESTVSNGIVSGVRTAEELGGKFLQITAPISPGSSGGPLFNMAGEVVGITTMHVNGGENLNFAIPINDVKQLLVTAVYPRGPVVKGFPNGPETKETQSEATHERDTLEGQKMCSHQTNKVRQKAIDEVAAELDFNQYPQTFDVVRSHYDASTDKCYVEISRSIAMPEANKAAKFNSLTRTTSDGWLRAFYIYDGDGKVGTFIQTYPYETPAPYLPSIYLYCEILPPHDPGISAPRATTQYCESLAEFDDLAFKYFGIPK